MSKINFFKVGDVYMVCMHNQNWVGTLSTAKAINDSYSAILKDVYILAAFPNGNNGEMAVSTAPLGEVIINLTTANLVHLSEKNTLYKLYKQVTSGIIVQ